VMLRRILETSNMRAGKVKSKFRMLQAASATAEECRWSGSTCLNQFAGTAAGRGFIRTDSKGCFNPDKPRFQRWAEHGCRGLPSSLLSNTIGRQSVALQQFSGTLPDRTRTRWMLVHRQSLLTCRVLCSDCFKLNGGMLPKRNVGG
jgi:hypothetical protein